MSWSALLKVAPHVHCVALPRAKGGILRNARGMDLVAVEALSHSEEPPPGAGRRLCPPRTVSPSDKPPMETSRDRLCLAAVCAMVVYHHSSLLEIPTDLLHDAPYAAWQRISVVWRSGAPAVAPRLTY